MAFFARQRIFLDSLSLPVFLSIVLLLLTYLAAGVTAQCDRDGCLTVTYKKEPDIPLWGIIAIGVVGLILTAGCPILCCFCCACCCFSGRSKSKSNVYVNNQGPTVSTQQVTNHTQQSMGTAYHGGQQQQQPISPSFYNYNAPAAAQGPSYNNAQPGDPMRMEQSYYSYQGQQQHTTSPSTYPQGTAGSSIGFYQYSNDSYNNASPPPYPSAGRFNPVQRSPSHNNRNGLFPRPQVASTPYASGQLEKGYGFQKK